MKRQLFLILSGLFFIQLSVAATVTATLDRTKIAQNETVNLNLRTDQATNQLPDLKQLQQTFTVLATNQSQQISNVNGQIKNIMSWRLTLQPKHSGKLSIPAIVWGQAKSQALSLTVTRAVNIIKQLNAHDKNAFFDLSVDEVKPYVQGQVLVTSKLYLAMSVANRLQNLQLTKPDIKHSIIRFIGQPSQYTTELNGKQYAVIQMRYAIFPQQSGALSIKSVGVRAQLLQAQAPERSNDPLANDFFANATLIPFELKAISKTIQVQAEPAQVNSQTWLPAKALSLSEDWQLPAGKLTPGQPIVRHVTIKATGVLAAQLPDLSVEQVAKPNWRVYQSKPQISSQFDGENWQTIKRYKLSYVPSAAGNSQFPALSMSWWDSVHHKPQLAYLPAKGVTIVPGTESTQAQSKVIAVKASLPTPGAANAASSPVKTKVRIWQNPLWWVVAALVIIWLLTLFFWYRSRRRSVPAEEVTGSQRLLLARIKQACQQADVSALSAALLQFAAVRWPRTPVTSLHGLAELMGSPTLSGLMAELEQRIYGQSSSPQAWSGDLFWQEFKRALVTKPGALGKKAKGGDIIPPMYPQ